MSEICGANPVTSLDLIAWQNLIRDAREETVQDDIVFGETDAPDMNPVLVIAIGYKTIFFDFLRGPLLGN